MAEKVRDGVDGLHFRTGNPHDLARTLQACSTTPELWERLAAGISRPPTIGESTGQHLRLLQD
jgi:hypothetical protein